MSVDHVGSSLVVDVVKGITRIPGNDQQNLTRETKERGINVIDEKVSVSGKPYYPNLPERTNLVVEASFAGAIVIVNC